MNEEFSKMTKSAWYELSYKSPSELYLRVHRLAYDELVAKHADGRGRKWTDHPQAEFKLPEFVVPGNGDCGYGGILKACDSGHSDWVSWRFALPLMKDASRDDVHDLILRATLHVIFVNLSLFEGETLWHEDQLVVIDQLGLPSAGRFAYGGNIGIVLMPPVIKWLKSLRKQKMVDIVEVTTAMRESSTYMFPSSFGEGLLRFGTPFRPPTCLNFNIPGNSCGLDPDSKYDEDELNDGYTLVSHNVDGTLPQLTLLAGVARLHDLVRGK
jgi:hypothetical protein